MKTNTTLPNISILSLEKELLNQYGIDYTDYLAEILFPDFWLISGKGIIYLGETEKFDDDDNEEYYRILGCVKSILQDMYPEERYCIVNIF